MYSNRIQVRYVSHSSTAVVHTAHAAYGGTVRLSVLPPPLLLLLVCVCVIPYGGTLTFFLFCAHSPFALPKQSMSISGPPPFPPPSLPWSRWWRRTGKSHNHRYRARGFSGSSLQLGSSWRQPPRCCRFRTRRVPISPAPVHQRQKKKQQQKRKKFPPSIPKPEGAGDGLETATYACDLLPAS